VTASCYNRARLALLRLGNPLRVDLDAVGQAAMILDDRGWLCVDSGETDQPLFLLTNFAVTGRSALHAPVQCEVRLYHAHAGLLLRNVLVALESTLNERLAAHPQ
jgi:hypothetical protein